jgi:UDP-N-acetylmuramyl tripeptide synthase
MATPPIKQPNRSATDARRMTEAEQALSDTIEHAKNATTLKAACSGLEPLAKKLNALEHVTPPVGFEQAFSTERNALGMTLGAMMDQDCADGSGMDADTIRDGLENLHKTFARLQRIGAQQ